MIETPTDTSIIINFWIREETLKIDPTHEYNYCIGMWQIVAPDGSWQVTPRSK